MSRPVTTEAEGAQAWPKPHLPTPEQHGAAKQRLHALDAIRGTAMFLVVTFHAALAYTHIDIPRVVWVVRDPAPHLGFDLFSWWAMGVSNPLFFTMAGFFAANLYESRGPLAFLKDRTKKIVVPLAVGLSTILPLEMLVWGYGWWTTGRCNWHEFKNMHFHDPELAGDRYGPGHLWFLYYLIPMLLAYWLVRQARPSRPATVGNWIDRLLLSPWKPLVLMVPTILILWISRWQVGIDEVFDRHNTFGFDPLRLLHHGSFFLVGSLLYRVRHNLGRLAAQGLPYLALSLIVFAGRAWLLRADWTHSLTGPAALALSVLGALFGWLTVFGVIGAYQRFFDAPQPIIRYLADSSYWVYLWHLPVLGLAQADLYKFAFPALVKFPIVLTVTLAVGLSSYQVFVRYTAIGAWLHGPRVRPGQAERHEHPATAPTTLQKA